MEAVAPQSQLVRSPAANLGRWVNQHFLRRMTTLRLALLVLGLSLTQPVLAQPPGQLPPVRVQAKYEDPMGGTWPDSLRQVIRDSLARGRERWERTRPPQYLVAAITTWSMFVLVRDSTYDGQIEAARVRGDSIVAVIHRPAPQYTRRTQWLKVSVDSLFRHLEAEVASPTRKVDVLTLDSVWGYPRSWRTDYARNGYGRSSVSEQVSGGAVVFFEPETERSCAWWRRWLHKCA